MEGDRPCGIQYDQQLIKWTLGRLMWDSDRYRERRKITIEGANSRRSTNDRFDGNSAPLARLDLLGGIAFVQCTSDKECQYRNERDAATSKAEHSRRIATGQAKSFASRSVRSGRIHSAARRLGK